MPTHDQIRAVKAHLKLVDHAQEFILEDMFADLRRHYENRLLEREHIVKKKFKS